MLGRLKNLLTETVGCAWTELVPGNDMATVIWPWWQSGPFHEGPSLELIPVFSVFVKSCVNPFRCHDDIPQGTNSIAKFRTFKLVASNPNTNIGKERTRLCRPIDQINVLNHVDAINMSNLMTLYLCAEHHHLAEQINNWIT